MNATVQHQCLSVLERTDLPVTDALLPAGIFKPCGLKQYLNIFKCKEIQ
jgi:hypothetical protein